jgi:hypothetical protein
LPVIIPDIDWYTRRSQEMGITPRCPFSSVETCPRYYQSLSLLKDAGSTAINPKEDQRLLKYWKKSDLWPKTGEQATAIGGEPGNPGHFWIFCPEVAFERFGYFASSLNAYADELDHNLAHEKLGREHAPLKDWRWAWSSIKPMHYAECPLYSVLEHRSKRDEVLPEKPPELFQQIAWFLRHWKRYWLIIVIAATIIVLSILLNMNTI